MAPMDGEVVSEASVVDNQSCREWKNIVHDELLGELS